MFWQVYPVSVKAISTINAINIRFHLMIRDENTRAKEYSFS